jgi:hypothetical protein
VSGALLTGLPTFTYPSIGVPCSSGTSWCASYAVGTGTNNLLQILVGGQLPPISGAALTNLPLVLTTTGTSGTATYYQSTNTLNIPQYTPTSLASLGGTSTYGSVADGSPISWNVGSNAVQNGAVTLNHSTSTRALNMSGLVNGGFYTLIITQDSTGGAAMTLGSGCTWKVSGGGTGTITLTGTANSVDVLAITYNGTSCLANLQTNFN